MGIPPTGTDGLSIRRVPIDSLHLDPANARAHGDVNLAAIEASLQRFGQAEPLVVQASTHRVIGGNGRLVAMQKLGWAEADVVELDVDDLQATALGIALNRTGELAEWDGPALGRILAELRELNALDGVGFDDGEIDALLAELEMLEEPGEVDDPGPGEPPEDPVTRSGDLWSLGRHRILCGDSTSADDVARLMAGEQAALLVTDPPYLVDYQGEEWDGYKDDDAALGFFVAWLLTALPHCVDGVPIYQWHAHRRQALVERAWQNAGLLVHQQLIWAKTRGTLGRSHYMWAHEPAFYGWVQGNMPPKERRPPAGATTVWQIDQAGQLDGVHPTQKPTEIFERPIACHTLPGEIVLEPFSGSGSQIIAAQKLGRSCFAMELSPAFVDVAVRRWEQATGEQALRHDGVTFEEASSDEQTTTT